MCVAIADASYEKISVCIGWDNCGAVSTVDFTQAGGVATLVFKNVAKHNALGNAELSAIERALATLNEESRVLLIHAQGDRTFCAGADLSQIASGELSGNRFQEVTNQIAAAPVPTIALINGNVFGGGVELALSCDFRIGVKDTVMRIPAAALGLCYPPEGIRRMVRRLGVQLAKRVLVAAEELEAEQMLSLGIVDALHTREEAITAAESRAQAIAALAPLAVAHMLRIIRSVENDCFDATDAQQLADQCANSRDFQEGMLARSERRAPQFNGT